MKAKAMCIKRICIAFFDAADDSAANSYYPKKLFQAVRGNNGNADEGDGLLQAANLARGFLFIGKTSEYVVIKCRIKVKLDIKTIMLYTKIVLKSN